MTTPLLPTYLIMVDVMLRRPVRECTIPKNPNALFPSLLREVSWHSLASQVDDCFPYTGPNYASCLPLSKLSEVITKNPEEMNYVVYYAQSMNAQPTGDYLTFFENGNYSTFIPYDNTGYYLIVINKGDWDAYAVVAGSETETRHFFDALGKPDVFRTITMTLDSLEDPGRRYSNEAPWPLHDGNFFLNPITAALDFNALLHVHIFFPHDVALPCAADEAISVVVVPDHFYPHADLKNEGGEKVIVYQEDIDEDYDDDYCFSSGVVASKLCVARCHTDGHFYLLPLKRDNIVVATFNYYIDESLTDAEMQDIDNIKPTLF